MGETSSENKDDGSSRKHEEMIRTKPGSLRLVLKDSDWKDVLLMVMGSIGSVADGSAMALIMLCLGSLMNGYASSALTPHDINKYAMSLLYVAVGVGSGAFLEGFCWARTAERQTLRLRRRYLGAVLRQDVGFFDTNHGASMTSQVVSSISTDTLTIQGVLTEKIANFLMHMSTFITGQLVALYLSWRLAIVAIPALSMLIIPGLVYGKLLGGVGEKIQEAYAVAGGIVEQTVSSMRTVYSYVAEDRMLKSYKIALEPTLKLGIKQGLLKGMAMGSIGITFAVWALQGWYGSTLVKKNAKGGHVFTAGVCIIYAGLSLGAALINVKYLLEANVAASRIFEMIHRVPNIDSADQQGITVLNVKGELEFKDIDFAYPSRPENLVLRKFSLRVMDNQTVGLVGITGSGKSTIINLLERFYDPLQGKILLDGIDIKTLQLRWLRSQMGLVSQEPILFATSIKENILFGKDEASMEDIVVAAKAANAHNFINQLPDGYDTLVGQLGSQMSEGQKQRISIARALLRDPKILLLDEATSALDSHSEKAVQDALNQASIGRTTIIIAHRLSALRNVDLIAVIQSGEVVESGFHDELMGRRGSYSGMVQLQRAFISDDNGSTTKSMESNSSDFLDKGTPRTEDKANESDMQISSHDKITNHLQEDPKGSPSLWYLMCMTVSEWKSTVLGCIGGVCYGMIQPLYSFCLGGLLSVYVITDHREITSQTRTYCFAFLSFAVFAFITNVFQHYHFGIMGESLTKRVRETLFGKILTFEIEWFDQENNSSGSLCSRLAIDATMVRTLLTDRLSMLAQNISSATLAAVLGAMLSWKLALVAIAMQPFIIGAFYTKAIMMKSMSRKLLKAQNKSSELASEAVANHRIITAFYSQEKILKLHELTQIGSTKESRKQSWYAGLGLSISQFLTAANAALIFWYGGKLLYQKQITYKHLFQTFFILVSTGRIIAETGSMTSDLSKGTSALKSIFVILKRKSKIDIDDSDGFKPEKINGEIEFKEVDFFYPTRPKLIILMHLSLKIDAGTVVALVGQSGSGKSTIIRLIERFYEPSNGSVEVDGVDIKHYNLRALRSHIALVSQEPTLFMGTVHDNIAYGKENATEAEIVEAATVANAHDFIRGVQLSGGQKQRVALARAILKNPAILLLDEATSSLDINSEKLVQDALEKTMVGRTCVVVAHRLSTVQKSDKITVVENGRIIEQGSHSELLAKEENGAYFSLVKFQQLATIGQDVIGHDQARPSG
ncbi:hypothetical protein Dsin_008279 [Dipteronia sinensis]|uniref:Uncharacterized protein n=1 Tax=Dipteronia sinensis TaxID=43782 RepID=A0AAE0API3_9ROSI|nr:hypothetical protein Dsin_008279 [Dipteronia sinensis]